MNLNHEEMQALYEVAQQFAHKNHPDVEPGKFLFLVDEYLKYGVLAQMWVKAEESFSSQTVH